MTVLRASSLEAVTIFVCSTRLNPNSTAHCRTTCRTRTTSSSCRTGSSSVLTRATAAFLVLHDPLQELHPALDGEGGAHALPGQPQLHQRDRHRRPHARH